LLKSHGYCVRGSDRGADAATLARLNKAGIAVDSGHSAENIQNPSLVVYTLALADDNPELRAAREKNILAVSRAELLGYLMQLYPRSIAVAGVHGKSTVTAMLCSALSAAGEDPTVVSGAPLSQGDLPVRIGKGDIFVAEACEYMDSFLCLRPRVAVALNLEHEHTDYFKSKADMEASFARYIAGANCAVLPSEGKDFSAIPLRRGQEVVRFGCSPTAASSASAVTWEGGCASFDYYCKGCFQSRVKLAVPGEHNLINALATLAAVSAVGADVKAACRGISSFLGAERRLQRRGVWREMTVYDDYAHHPTEIKASLSALRRTAEKGRLLCVFQPHMYSRTAAFFAEFVHALSLADKVYLLDIYAAREKNESGISSADLASAIAGAAYLPNREEVWQYLAREGCAGDTVVFMGAGDIAGLTADFPV